MTLTISTFTATPSNDSIVLAWSPASDTTVTNYEVYVGNTNGFTPDTTGFTNLIARVSAYQSFTYLIDYSNTKYFQVRAITPSAAGAFASVTGTTGTYVDPSPYVTKGVMSISVKDYGARGDGTTVDTIAIQNTINICAAAGGGIVYLPSGTYIASGLVLATNISFRGAGKGVSVLKQDPATTNTFVIRSCGSSASASNVELKDLTIDGNQASYGNASNARMLGYYLGVGSGFTLTDCLVSNVEFKNCKSYALDIECQSGGTMNRILVDGCHIHDNGFTSGTGTNISCDGITMIGDDITVTNCFVENNSANGILLGQTGFTWHRNRVIGCLTVNNGQTGIKIGDLLQHSTVMGNTCIGNGVATTHTSGYGISLTAAAILNTVTGNTCIGNYVNGIRIDGVTYNTITGNTVSGNNIRNTGDPEIYLTNSATHNIVSANIIDGTASSVLSEQNTTSSVNLVIGNMVKTGSLNPAGTGSIWAKNMPYQPQNHSVTQPAMPATTVAATIPAKTAQQDCMVYVTAGAAATSISVGGTTALSLPAAGVGSVYVPAGAAVIPTYASGSPTWTWFGV